MSKKINPLRHFTRGYRVLAANQYNEKQKGPVTKLVQIVRVTTFQYQINAADTYSIKRTWSTSF